MRSVALAVSLSIVACTPRARTQVDVVVEAEGSIARDAIRVQTRVLAGHTMLTESFSGTTGSMGDPVSFPLRAAIVPEGGDATRRFRFEATALDAMGQELGTVRALSGFLPGRHATLRLVLEECCRSVRCAATQTCRGCACVTETLPIEDRDAGRTDARTLAADGGPLVDAARDASRPPDAPPPDAVVLRPDAFTPSVDTGQPILCGTGANCWDFARGSTTLSAPLVMYSWSAPSSASCSAPPGATLGTEVLRVANTTAWTLTIQISTSVRATRVAAYDDAGSDARAWPTPPAHPEACLAVGDAALSLSMPPGSLYRIAVSSTDGATGPVDIRLMSL